MAISLFFRRGYVKAPDAGIENITAPNEDESEHVKEFFDACRCPPDQSFALHLCPSTQNDLLISSGRFLIFLYSHGGAHSDADLGWHGWALSFIPNSSKSRLHFLNHLNVPL